MSVPAMDTVLRWAMATPDMRRVAVAAKNGEVAVWQLGPHRLVHRVQIPGPHPMHSARTPPIALDRSGELLAAAGDDGRVSVWRLEPFDLLLTATPTPPGIARHKSDGRPIIHFGTWAVKGLALSPDGRMLVTSVGDMLISWDVASGARRDSMWVEHAAGKTTSLSAVSFSTHSGLLFAIGGDGLIFGIDAARMRVEWHFDTGLGPLSFMTVGPSGRLIAVADMRDQVVALFDVLEHREACRFEVPFAHTASFSRNGRALVVGDGRSGITIVEVETCRPLARYQDFAGTVVAAWFGPECRSVIVGVNVAPRLFERRIPFLHGGC